MQYIGKLNKKLLGKYSNRLVTNDVILTDERMLHIMEHHPELDNNEIQLVRNVLNKPDYIFMDRKNNDTILLVKKIKYNNKIYRMVVKLNTNIEFKNKANSIISFWHINERKLKQYKRNETIIYKQIDIDV